MQVVKHISGLREALGRVKKGGKTIGFVPTMGALHPGHVSLVEKAGRHTDFVVVSIFVNPTQFNDKEDLKRYPRDLNKDLTLLAPTACQLVFAPEAEEIYPAPDTRRFDFGEMGTIMEGKYRPGHFNGVAQVVSKLFEMVQPDKAFFGLKDFQQFVIIKSLVKQLTLPVEIVPCDIVRETDGLAMSSRNMLLDAAQRKNAVHISQTLFEARNKKHGMSVKQLCEWVVARIDENDYLKTEYFEIVDDEKLQPVASWDEPVNKVGCIAVHCGKIRLIDNIIFN
ncbi:MAG: pantoate--beta-alanine ligase [Prolixibacteraceae bacterium]|jgi:pantoate--beta-alanine ligase|nr:pantoate--beta-alanine ligase [Prolixibacteraceae bacterium]